MTAKQNKRGNVPAHNKHADGNAHNCSTYRIYIAQIFRCQEQSIGTKSFHEAAINRGKKYVPENKHYLVLSKMQKYQLNG